MKKKTVLIILVVLICSVLGVLGNNFTKKLVLAQAQKNSEAKVTVTIDSTKGDIESSKMTNTDATSQPSPGSTAKASGVTPEVKANTSSSSSNKSSVAASTKNDTGSTTVPDTPKAENKNFYIINAITSETIYSSFETYSGQDSVSAITKIVLDRQKIDYLITSFGTYFSRIASLKEGSHGGLSGWCYFINGVKPSSLGAAQYYPKAGDIIEWRFLEDGTK